MGIAPRENLGALCLVAQGAKPQTAADDTYIASEIYDRLAAAKGTPQSCICIAIACFTSSSGASGATNTVTMLLQHGDNSALSDAATLDSDTYAYTWAANGDNDGVHVLPVDLRAAKRYLKFSAKLTKAGTITISDQSIATCVVFGGMKSMPSSSFAAAGYEETTEPS